MTRQIASRAAALRRANPGHPSARRAGAGRALRGVLRHRPPGHEGAPRAEPRRDQVGPGQLCSRPRWWKGSVILSRIT